MEELTIPNPTAPWWQSRRQRQRVYQAAIFLIVLYPLWKMLTDEWRNSFWLILLMGFSRLPEWLWFRLLDPNYPHDDLPKHDSSNRPVDDWAWWRWTVVPLQGAIIVGLLVAWWRS